jgi:AcrR family transcriptional regulator
MKGCMQVKADKGDKREKIIGAALRLFCQQGFQATSTALIAKEAGVATGTLFLYFSSKDVLINALYQEAKAGLTAHLQEGYPEQSGVGDRFRHLWFSACCWGLENPDAFRFMTMFRSSPYIWQVTRAEAASAAAFARQLVQEGLETGILQPIGKDFFLALLDGAVTTTVTFLQGNNDQAAARGVIEQSWDIFWKGVIR